MALVTHRPNKAKIRYPKLAWLAQLRLRSVRAIGIDPCLLGAGKSIKPT